MKEVIPESPVLTPKSAIGDIIAKLEAATGPDRELDARIHVAMFPGQVIMTDCGSVGGPSGIRPAAYSSIGAVWPEGRGLETDPRGFADLIQSPHYTTSIDASLALVEEQLPGVWYIIGKGKTRDAEPPYGAQLLFGDAEILGEGEHLANLPLAVLIALFGALDDGASSRPTGRLD